MLEHRIDGRIRIVRVRCWLCAVSTLYVSTYFSTYFASAASPVTAIAFSPEHKHLLIGSQNGIEIRSWPSLEPQGQVSAGMDHVHDLKFAPGGRRFAVCGGEPSEAGIVEIYEWPSMRRFVRTSPHADVVYRVSWSSDGRRYATAGADGICIVFDSENHREVTRYVGHSRSVLALEYLKESNAIASAGADFTIQIWNPMSGTHIRTLDNHVGSVNAIATRPDVARQTDASKSILASISEDRTVRIWQPEDGRLVRFGRLPSIPRAMSWTRDGSQLLIGCNDGVLRIVNFATCEVVRESPLGVGRIYEVTLCVETGSIAVGGQNGIQAAQLPE